MFLSTILSIFLDKAIILPTHFADQFHSIHLSHVRKFHREDRESDLLSSE